MHSPVSIAVLWLAVLFSGYPVRAQSCLNVDLNLDHVIDYLDLAVLTDDWLWTKAAGATPADVWADGRVDFRDLACLARQWQTCKSSVAIWVDPKTYTALEFEMERLAADIERDLDVDVLTYCWDRPEIEGIKEVLLEDYLHRGLIGAILVGEIPTSFSEYQNSGATPSDWYYMDLSDEFYDTDGDGRFEREFRTQETDVTMRDIWCGRIKPPVEGPDGIALLRSYLERNHAYRSGQLSYPRQMMFFHSVGLNQGGMSQSDYLGLANDIAVYTGFYDTNEAVVPIYADSLLEQKDQYLQALTQPWEIGFVNIHGSPWQQWLGGSVYVDYQEIAAAEPQCLFTMLASCSNGDFTRSDYLAGWSLFSGQSLVVMANSTVTMLVGGNSPDFLRDMVPLKLGVTFGDMHLHDCSGETHHLLGDPTLRLRPKPAGPAPHIVLDRSQLDFGMVPLGQQAVLPIEFSNLGTQTASLQFKKGRFSIDGQSVMLGYWDVFQYRHPETGSTFRPFDIPPDQSESVPVVFYPRADAPGGHYSMTLLLQSNDPNLPYISLYLQGDAREPTRP